MRFSGAARALFLFAAIAANQLPARASARGKHGPSAIHLLRAGKVNEAAQLLQKQLAADPKNATVATDLAFAEQLLGHRDLAEALFHQAIELDPQRWYAYANLASMKATAPLSAPDRDILISLLERGLSLQKRSKDKTGPAGILLAMADVERAAGNLGAARGRLAQAEERTLTSGQSRLAAAMHQAIDGAAQKSSESHPLEVWPEPPISPELAAQLGSAESLLARDPHAALQEAERLSALHRTWRGPRWLRARALIELEQLDAGTRELDALLRLDPKHAAAWRLLGETLANHGGQFEADRADAALQQALALEPAWIELWELRARVLFRSGRAADAERVLSREEAELRLAGEPIPAELSAFAATVSAQASAAPRPEKEPKPAPEPSIAARDLLRQAQDLLAEGNSTDANDRLSRALADSPSLIEAAALRWALTGAPPDETARALWNDPRQLLRLSAAARDLALAQTLGAAQSPDLSKLELDAGAPLVQPRPWLEASAVSAMVNPWIDRAASLGDSVALLQRAQLRTVEKNDASALEDLGAAVAEGLGPELLQQAHAIRQQLHVAGEADGAPNESPCSLAQGAAYELAGDVARALDCYQAALQKTPDDRAALLRLSRAAGHAPIDRIRALADPLSRAENLGIASALFPQARRFAAEGKTDDALAALDRFLAARPEAGFVEPGVAEAQSLRARLEKEKQQSGAAEQTRRKVWIAMIASLLALLAIALVLRFRRGLSVASALARDASLFPAVARAVAEIRHDALKHRASALAMLGSAPREEVARALNGSRPASALIEDAYAELLKAARARSISLAPLRSEPAFGPLFSDLRFAEQQLAQPAGPRDSRITQAAARMPAHGERLAALLKLGPRTRLDAAVLASWIGNAEAELRAKGAAWSSPALQLEGLELDFPIAPEPLAAIFANLIRNAQAAAARSPAPRVLVRVAEEKDAAGRRVLELQLGDSSEEPLALEQIEARESGRGLALVRDLVREWQGHLRVRKEGEPWRKSVAACFPMHSP